MQLVYYTLTYNTKRLAERLGEELFNVEPISIKQYDGQDEFILLTPTLGYGHSPLQVEYFLEKHHANCIGTISTGHKNWGEHFATAGDHIQEKHGIPHLLKVEQRGQEVTIEKFREVFEKNGIQTHRV